MNGITEEARQYLLQKYAISVPDEWLTACVEYLIESGDSQNVKDSVYYQWQHCDLQQLEQPCLPREMLQRDNYILNGTFCVQVNSFRDISQPAYLQLQKLKGRELDEADEPGAEWKSEWKKKKETPRRMLKMELSDGVTVVSAMEYQPIPSLNPDVMQPGCKLQLRGRITCKRGAGMPKNATCILMLNADNVNFLGGSVDTLLEQNSVAKVLEQQIQKSAKSSGNGNQEQTANRNAGASIANRQTQPVLKSTTNNNNTIAQKRAAVVKPAQPVVKPPISTPSVPAPPKQPLPAARVSPFTSENKAFNSNHNNNYDDIDDMDMDDFVAPLIRQTGSTVVGSIRASNQSSYSSFGSRTAQNNLTSTTISASIQPSNTASFNSRHISGNNYGQADAKSSHFVIDDEDDDENILRAVACVEEEEEPHHDSFTVDFDGLYSGLNDLPEPEQEIDENVPFTYLSKALNDPCQNRFVIKGFVLSVAGKLEFTSSTGLSLKVRVADSSATLECTLSQEVVKMLLGFSAAEARILHSQATTSKDVSASKLLSEGLVRFKHKLASLTGLLTIQRCPQFANTSPQFELVEFSHLTIDDCHRLFTRVDAKL